MIRFGTFLKMRVLASARLKVIQMFELLKYLDPLNKYCDIRENCSCLVVII